MHTVLILSLIHIYLFTYFISFLYIFSLVLGLVLPFHLSIYWVILVKSHCTIVFNVCFFACYISLIRGYFYYYFYLFDRIIMLITHSFISDSSLFIHSVNHLVFYSYHVASLMHVEDMYPYICLLYTSRCV